MISTFIIPSKICIGNNSFHEEVIKKKESFKAPRSFLNESTKVQLSIYRSEKRMEKIYTTMFPNGARCSKRERECATVKSVTLSAQNRERERERETKSLVQRWRVIISQRERGREDWKKKREKRARPFVSAVSRFHARGRAPWRKLILLAAC